MVESFSFDKISFYYVFFDMMGMKWIFTNIDSLKISRRGYGGAKRKS